MKWPVKKLSEICEINIGRTPSRSNANYWKNGEYAWLSISDMTRAVDIVETKEKISNLAISECNCKLVPINTVLLSFKLSIGKVGINKIPLYTNEAIAALPIKQTKILSNRFLFHALKNTNFTEGVDRAAKGLTLNKEKLKEVKIPFPPLAEQQRIAAVLDTADRIHKQRESAIAKLDQLAQSVFVDMFGNLVSNSNSWPVVKLNDACLIKAQYGAGLSAVEFNSSLPRYVRITDINEDGSLNEKVVSPSGSKSDWADYFLNDGDILFARSGATVGKAYLHSNQIQQCIYAGYLIRFIPNKKLMTSEFLYALTKSSFYKNWVKAKQNAVAQPNINANQYGNELVFPLPPITLQEKFTNFHNKIKSFKEVEILASIKHNQLQSSIQHQSFAVN